MQRRKDKIVIQSLGFPVVLRNVPMRKFRGEWEPDIDWNALQHVVLLVLAHKPVSLTGNEVRFVRQFLEMTLKEFANACGLKSHQSVMNWERKGDKPTGMRKSTEIVLRARILEALPDKLWERLEESPHSPRETFSKRLAEVSDFDRGHENVPIELLAQQGSELVYQYS